MADKSSTANSRLAEGLPIDEWCRQFVPSQWHAYEQACTGVSDLEGLRKARIASRQQRGKLCPKPDQERWLNASDALDTELQRRMEKGEFELRGRRGSPVAEPERIPASALKWLEINYERQTASGQGEQFYDLWVQAAKAPRKLTPKTWITDEFSAMRQAGELPEGITDCSKTLHGRMKEAHKANPPLKVLRLRTIENYLRKLKLWPLR